jgi:hypothetical protein
MNFNEELFIVTFGKKQLKMTTNEQNDKYIEVKSVAELNQYSFRATSEYDSHVEKAKAKNEKYAGIRIIYFEFYTQDGGKLEKRVSTAFEEAKMRNLSLPYLDKTKKGGHDTGAEAPEITLECPKDSDDRKLAIAYLQKLDDATLAYSYGLERPGMSILKIERVPIPNVADTFIPRIHYSNGDVVDIRRDHIKEVVDNQLKYFEIERTTGNVYFTDFSCIKDNIFDKKNQNETLFLKYWPYTKHGAEKKYLKRKKDSQATPQQQNIDEWGIEIRQSTKDEDGKWRPGKENIASQLNWITKPGQNNFLVGNAKIHILYLAAGANAGWKFGGFFNYIAPGDKDKTKTPEGGEATFQASASSDVVPIQRNNKAPTNLGSQPANAGSPVNANSPQPETSPQATTPETTKAMASTAASYVSRRNQAQTPKQ